ncbi:hypothetical protein A4A49_59468, partial [Nicotiana attenuata]
NDITSFVSTRGGFQQKPKKTFNLVCDYCNYKGHTRENYFKLNGYPADFKHKKKGSSYPPTANFAGNMVVLDLIMYLLASMISTPLPSAPYFTPEQYRQILHMLEKVNEESVCSAQPPPAGIFALISSIVDDRWIIDIGATNHMVGNSNMLTELNKESNLKGGNVHLRNGNVVSIENTWKSRIFKNQDLQNVLHIPDFKFNHLSVSKLTKELMCCVAFFS